MHNLIKAKYQSTFCVICRHYTLTENNNAIKCLLTHFQVATTVPPLKRRELPPAKSESLMCSIHNFEENCF